MKIRIKGNSIRIRLEQDEISKISLGETVVNTTVFSPLDSLTFSISKWNLSVFGADFKKGGIQISIPASFLETDTNSSNFSIEGMIENGHEKGLKILVEVDLPCEHK
jgi:hypothetical protein